MSGIIEITNVTKVEKNSLLATCDVTIVPWKMTLHSVRIHQKGAQKWLGMPSRQYEQHGEVKYQELITFEGEATKKRFRDQVMAAVDQYLLNNPDMTAPPLISANDDLPF